MPTLALPPLQYARLPESADSIHQVEKGWCVFFLGGGGIHMEGCNITGVPHTRLCYETPNATCLCFDVCRCLLWETSSEACTCSVPGGSPRHTNFAPRNVHGGKLLYEIVMHELHSDNGAFTMST